MIGLKTIIRTPVKTALFFMLIAVVTVFLALGVGMLHSANRMLDEADMAFLTAGEFVFMGGRYPDAVAFDPELKAAASSFDLDLIAKSPAVLSAEQSTLQRAYLDGYVPARKDMPYEKYAVLSIVVKNVNTVTGNHIALVTGTQYSAEDMLDNSIYVYSHDSMETPLQVGGTYIVFGGFLTVPGQVFRGFQILPFDVIDSLANMPVPPIIDITGARDIGAVWQSKAGACGDDLSGV